MTAKVIRMRFTRNGTEQFAGTMPITLPEGAYLGDLQSDLSYMERTASQGSRALSLVIEDGPLPPPPVEDEAPPAKKLAKKKAEPKVKAVKAKPAAKPKPAAKKKAAKKSADNQGSLGLDDQ